MTFKERMFLAMAARPSWLGYLLTLFVLLLCVFLWWFLSYRHLSAQVARVQQQVVEQEQQRAQQAMLVQKQTAALATVMTHKELVDTSWESFFVCKQATTFVEKLVTLAQEHHLQIRSYRLSEPQKEPWGNRVELTCDLSGDFFSLISLFEQLEVITNVIGLGCDMQPMQDQRIRSVCRFALCLP